MHRSFQSGLVGLRSADKTRLEKLSIVVIDIDKNPNLCQAFYAEHTPNSAELKAKNQTLTQFYLSVCENSKEQLLSIS